MSRFFVVRHGNTFAPDEVPRRIGAHTDLPLAESGIEQAQRLANWFTHHGITPQRALAGRLKRTTETANVILAAQRLPPPLEMADWLTEINYGPDEGMTEQAVRARVGEDALRRWDGAAEPPPGWQVDAASLVGAWRRFMSEQEDDVLVVTSNGVARFALLAVGATIPFNSLKLNTGHFGIIFRTKKGELTIDDWNCSP